MGLKIYREKRKFDKTSEPEGENKKAAKNSDSIFVIQKHQASHLHYDFRLEVQGVLKSWAVPKGMPKPGEKHLAMMVEDHPFEYKDFEGVIPSGNYGAGTVMIWDKGTYFLKDKEDNSEILQKINKGDLILILNGQKIHGEFTMVKLKKAKGNAWLIIRKNDGENDYDDYSVESRLSMEEIGSPKFDVQKYPNAIKSPMPDFVLPMLTTLIEQPFNDKNWMFEIKWDGYRTMAIKKNDQVSLYSRNKKSFNELFSTIANALREIPGDFILDGEVVAVDKKGISNFQLLQNYLMQRKGMLVYYVFDIVYFNGYDLKKIPLYKRREILSEILKDQKYIRLSEEIKEKGIELFKAISLKGSEGIIGKRADSEYRENFRGTDWVKIKVTLSQDAIICGFTEPRKGRKKFGALVLGIYEHEKLVYIGHVGGGFNDIGLSKMKDKLLKITVKKSPFEIVPKTNTPVTWVIPKFVCQVKFSEWTNEGIMRQPIFIGLRVDKKPEEVQRELPVKSIEDINKSLNIDTIIKPKRKVYKVKEEGVEEIVDGKKLLLTNLNKVYWPEEGYTKGDLIDYYKKVSKYILPYLIDRPQSLNRFPNGIHGENFFHKDMREIPDWIKAITVYTPSEDREINYMLCQDLASLIYMINLGCIEINPWNSSIGNLENPDYMVLDIDPQNLPFSSAVEVALETKKILDEISVKGFCKTSGSRGLHVFIPLKAIFSYDQVREFSQLINSIINIRLPKITSLERKPNARDKKVYLDYLQNRKGQTMAAAYCVRPKAGAPVSTPLEWEELNENLHPQNFNIKSIFERLEKKGDVWKNFFSKKYQVDLNKVIFALEAIIKEQETKE